MVKKKATKVTYTTSRKQLVDEIESLKESVETTMDNVVDMSPNQVIADLENLLDSLESLISIAEERG